MMPPSPKFIESICLENGELKNLHLHQQRLDLTMLAHFGFSVRIDLKTQLERRSLPAVGLFKVRVTYDCGVMSIDVDPYMRHKVQHIKLVHADSIDYRFKYADRRVLDALRHDLMPGTQPVIVQRGLITDAVYANVCVLDGARWLTPERPLLAGVARAAALGAGEIFPAAITAADFSAGKYSRLKLINCMALFSVAEEIFL